LHGGLTPPKRLIFLPLRIEKLIVFSSHWQLVRPQGQVIGPAQYPAILWQSAESCGGSQTHLPSGASPALQSKLNPPVPRLKALAVVIESTKSQGNEKRAYGRPPLTTVLRNIEQYNGQAFPLGRQYWACVLQYIVSIARTAHQSMMNPPPGVTGATVLGLAGSGLS
jgi:hypothetical protein